MRSLFQPLAQALRQATWKAGDIEHVRSNRFDTRVLPAGLELRWLGGAGFSLEYQKFTLAIDPYLSRLSIDALCSRRPLRSVLHRIDSALPHVDAIAVGHTHFDHAMDVPYLVGRDSSPAFGSSSLRQLLALHRHDSAAQVVSRGVEYQAGPFRLRFFASRHSRLCLGRAVPLPGEITCDNLATLHAGRFRVGDVYTIVIEVAGMQIVHLGSAELDEAAMPRLEADLVLVCLCGWQFAERFAHRLVQALQPKHIVPHHFDNFTVPIDEPMTPLPLARISAFCDEFARSSREPAVRFMSPGTLPFSPPAPS